METVKVKSKIWRTDFEIFHKKGEMLSLFEDVLLPEPVALEVAEEEAEDDQDSHSETHQDHQHHVRVI